MEFAVQISASGRTGISENADAVVPWRSFSKTLIAATALAMVRDGEVDLDGLLPGRDFTLRQLLQHRAGVADYGVLAAYHAAVARDDDAWTVDQLLQNVAADHAPMQPGAGFAYSNIGYLLVREYIERLSGVGLDVLMRRRLFAPLGVNGPRIACRRSDLETVAMGDSRSYDPRWVYHGLAVGSLYDAALLLHRLMATDFLPAALRAEMFEGYPVDTAGAGRPWRHAAYGLGVMTGTAQNGLRVIGHTGSGPGSVIAVYNLPDVEGGSTVAVFDLESDVGVVEQRAFDLGAPH